MAKQTMMTQLDAYFTKEHFTIEAPLNADEPIATWMRRFEENRYQALFYLGCKEMPQWLSVSMAYLHRIAETAVKYITQSPNVEIERELIDVSLLDDDCLRLQEEVPFVLGMEYVNDEWIASLFDAMVRVFKEEIAQFDGTVARYFAEKNANINVVGRVFFHLVEHPDETYPFAFMATYTTKPLTSKRAVHTPLKNALQEFEGDENKLLALIAGVIKVAQKSELISALMESGELFSPLKMTTEEAYVFLKELPLYEESGIMCRVPNWWRRKSNSFRVAVTVGQKEPSRVGLGAMLDFNPVMLAGDEPISKEALREFLTMAEGLVQYKGKWIEINKEKLASLLRAFDRLHSEESGLSLRDALNLELQGKEILGIEEDVEISVSNGEWLRLVRERLVSTDQCKTMALAPTFQATLRPYQERGYQWLSQMTQLRLGACLADDMGLGKTVQLIALLEKIRITEGGNVLLILPASLIGNWQKEIERFAPQMPYRIVHGSAKQIASASLDRTVFLHITTYGMAVRLDQLRLFEWDMVILDEAQAIKNPGTKQTKAIKQIPARMRIALTGTPIENRLGELWSLFDFLNQGLLGTAKEFTSFTKDLSSQTIGYAKLRKMIQPFMLRRLKTDTSIISDLPDKVEMHAYTTMTKKQIVLYQQLLKNIESSLLEAEGITRKGLIIASIMKAKQICNHPDQYIGQSVYLPEESGKFERLREICETIYEKRERVLVFTQFREMTGPLHDFMRDIFGKDGLVLHGGTTAKQRTALVEQFNGEAYVPYMVLSLKAGGVGLNLTAANHVIHFDRWWNPAVENQATDRAFRIGQKKNVMVHKFVTSGTIEEKISQMIEDKQKLSRDILHSEGEQWITELNNDEIISMFALRGEN